MLTEMINRRFPKILFLGKFFRYKRVGIFLMMVMVCLPILITEGTTVRKFVVVFLVMMKQLKLDSSCPPKTLCWTTWEARVKSCCWKC